MELYQKNIDILRVKYPALARALDDLVVPREYQYVPAKNGQANIKVCTDGREYYCHSTYDPQKESSRYIQTYYSDNEKQCLDAAFGIVVGLGCGYHVFDLLEKVTWLRELIVIEPDPALFKVALHHSDLTGLLSNKNISFVVGPIDLETFRNLPSAQWLNLGGVIIVPSLFMTGYGKEYLGKVNVLIAEFIQEKDLTARAYIHSGKPMLENQFKNIPFMFSYAPVNDLFAKFKGVPCVCIASGPSLTDYLDDLRSIRDKAIFICADSAFKVLIENGITPDIVTAVDPMPSKFKYFEENPHLTKDILLVAGTATYPGMLAIWQGPITMMLAGNTDFAFYFEDLAYPGVEHLPNFYTVALSSLIIGDRLGCDPVILVGQDLCIKDKDHAEGSTLQWKTELTERNGEKYIQNCYVGTPYVYAGTFAVKHGFTWYEKAYFTTDYDGNVILTTCNFLSYVRYFEDYLQNILEKNVYNLTNSGAKISGAKRINFSEINHMFYNVLEFDITVFYLENKINLKEKIVLEHLANLFVFAENLHISLLKCRQELRLIKHRSFSDKQGFLKNQIDSWYADNQEYMRLLDSHAPKDLLDQCRYSFLNYHKYSDYEINKKKYINSIKILVKMKQRLKKLINNLNEANSQMKLESLKSMEIPLHSTS